MIWVQTMISKLRKYNPNLGIIDIHDLEFNKYGKILNFEDFSEAKLYLDTFTKIPAQDNMYLAHDEEFLNSLTTIKIYHKVFGEVPLEFGYVNGQNTQLNSLEYHKSSEINIAITPLILLLGSVDDIKNKMYDSKKLIAVYIPENTAIEIYSSTLHFSPCKVQKSGFKCGVILPYGTNMNFMKSESFTKDEDYYLFKTNKYLLAHPEHHKIIHLGAHVGITGDNIEIKY